MPTGQLYRFSKRSPATMESPDQNNTSLSTKSMKSMWASWTSRLNIVIRTSIVQPSHMRWTMLVHDILVYTDFVDYGLTPKVRNNEVLYYG